MNDLWLPPSEFREYVVVDMRPVKVATNPPPPEPRVWRVGHGARHGYGLVRQTWNAASLWVHVRIGPWWFGLEVRWDPDLIGSKVMWTLFDEDVGWLQ